MKNSSGKIFSAFRILTCFFLIDLISRKRWNILKPLLMGKKTYELGILELYSERGILIESCRLTRQERYWSRHNSLIERPEYCSAFSNLLFGRFHEDFKEAKPAGFGIFRPLHRVQKGPANFNPLFHPPKHKKRTASIYCLTSRLRHF